MSVRVHINSIRELATRYEETRARLAELDAAGNLADIRREEEELAIAMDCLRLAVGDARERLARAENTVVQRLIAMA